MKAVMLHAINVGAILMFVTSADSVATPLSLDSRISTTPLAARAASLLTNAQHPTSKCSLLASFTRRFRGHFDNHAQAIEDGAAGLTPRLGGGHEHIHCHVQPLTLITTTSQASADAYALATYYFDGKPEAVFRERLYRMREVSNDDQFGHCIQMSIYRLRTETVSQLRENGGSAAAVHWDEADFGEEHLIPGCDVFWCQNGECFEGEMRTSSVVVESDNLGKPIIVRDDVSLWRDELWVNDRGTDIDGNYLYGNVRDIPYKLARVPDSHWTAREDVDDEPIDFESWCSGC